MRRLGGVGCDENGRRRPHAATIIRRDDDFTGLLSFGLSSLSLLIFFRYCLAWL